MAAETSQSSTGARPRFGALAPAVGIAALVVLAVPLFFLAIGSAGLFDPDEPYYAVPALEMLRTGTWSITIFRGQPWFDKPIFFYWEIVAAYRALGVSELSARIASAVAALAGVLGVFTIGRRGRIGVRGAFVSAVVLATMLEYAVMARAAVTDMTLTAFLTLGMLAAERWLATGRALAAGLAGAAFGLAALTKGPVGLVLPLVALLAYAALARRADVLRPAALAALAAGAVLTAGPWYAYMLAAHRDLLVDTFIGQGNIGRFVAPEHPSFPLYYPVVLAAGMLPWSGSLPAALWRAGRPSAWLDERGSRSEPGPLYLLCWFGAVLAVFSVTASKLPSYVLPAFPPAAILIGDYWQRGLDAAREARRARRDLPVSASLGLLAALLMAGAVRVTVGKPPWTGARPAAAALGAALVVGAVLAIVAVLRRSLPGFVLAHAVAAVAAVLVLCTAAIPPLERAHSTRPLARELVRLGCADEVAGSFGFRQRFSLDFYLARTIARTSDLGELRRQVAERPGGIWIVHAPQSERVLEEPTLIGTKVSQVDDLVALRLSPTPDRPETAR